MIWIDLVIVGALLLGLGLGAKRGFLQTLGGVLAATVVSFIGAGIAAGALSGTVAKWIRPLLEKKMQSGGISGGSAASMVREAGFFWRDRTNYLGLLTAWAHWCRRLRESLVAAVTDGIAQSVAYALVYLAAFLILMLVCRLLLRVLRLAERMPGLHALNLVGGGVLGLGVAVLLVFFAVWLLQRLQLVITEDMVQQSALLQFFVNRSPMDWLTSL